MHCDFFRCALRVASRHDDARIGILSPHSPDGRARILIRARGHRAGIHDDHGCLCRSRRAHDTALFELTFEGGAVSLGGAATEVFYKISSHIPMVTQHSASPRGSTVKSCGHQCPRPTYAEAAVLRD